MPRATTSQTTFNEFLIFLTGNVLLQKEALTILRPNATLLVAVLKSKAPERKAVSTQTVTPQVQENIGILVPRETSGAKPFMLNFVEPMFAAGSRGQTYMGSSPSKQGEVGDFEND